MTQLSPSSQSKQPRPEFVRLGNRIAGACRPLGFEWNGQPAQFFFSNEKLAPRGGWRMNITLGGHDMRLQLSRLPDLGWVSPTLTGMDLHSLPQELVCGLIEASFGEIFDALSHAGIDIRISSASAAAADSEGEERIEWCLNRGGETGWMRGHVAGTDQGLEHLASLIQRAPVKPALDDNRLPMPVALVAGRMRIGVSELQQVELHDVLLADLSAYRLHRGCELQSGKHPLGSGSLTNQTFTLQQPAPSPVATANPLINDLEVELTFVAGQSTLTVGELRNLAPGFTFELSAPAGDGVLICANGKPIGKGELIEVGDRTGVRVTELAAP